MTNTVSIHGRDVAIDKLVDTQVMLLAREARILQRDDISGDRKMEGLDRMFRILESVVQEDSDRLFLEGLMETGKLDLRELMSFVTGPGDPDNTPKVRRGRPPTKRA
jgi:hypothetical protein